jgi:hypothetical protein
MALEQLYSILRAIELPYILIKMKPIGCYTTLKGVEDIEKYEHRSLEQNRANSRPL